GRAAGIWQIMPATGRGLGLRIDADLDARLDLDLATRAVATMLQHDYGKLGDWRLADLAYNAGLYRLKRSLRDTEPVQPDAPLPELDLPEVTKNHLAKVQALACIVARPEQYAVELPDPDASVPLVRRPLAHALALPVAARLSGLDL